MEMSKGRDIIITPWISPNYPRNRLTIVVVSSDIDIIEKISEALIDVHATGDFKWKLEVLRSFYLEDIAKQSDYIGKKPIDFVIIAMDSRNISCVQWAKESLEQVHPDMRIRRVILVNASSPGNSMAVKSTDVITFCTDNKIEMLNANVSNQEDAQFLARKLLKYIEVSLGVKTGIPNLNI